MSIFDLGYDLLVLDSNSPINHAIGRLPPIAVIASQIIIWWIALPIKRIFKLMRRVNMIVLIANRQLTSLVTQ